MNRFDLGFSAWIIVLNIILLVIFIYTTTNTYDYFVNYPQVVDPTSTPKSDQEANAANNNYASILMYIQSHPSKSINFISDIKQKFFNNSCTVKDDINFNTIAQMPSGMPF